MHGPPNCWLRQVLGPVHQAVGEMLLVPLVACHPERLHQSYLLQSLGLVPGDTYDGDIGLAPKEPLIW